MDFSFQLYSARNFQPWPDVLRRLAEIGYRQVEGFGAVYGDAAGFRAELDRNGLTMPSAHFSVDMLENDFEEAERIASTLGARTMVAPYLQPADRPSDAAGYRALGERLAAIGDRARDAGYGFAWHNHDFEFQPLADGSLPQRLILDSAPDIGLELDVAWVVRGGGDPEAFIDEYGPRIHLVHIKDIAPAGEKKDEDGWADVGDGTVPWKRIMTRLRDKTPTGLFIMEHDNPSDLDRFARRSLEAARAL